MGTLIPGRPLVLVVEDEPAIADGLAYALGAEGFTVRCAATLGGARSELAQAPVLVILDIGLPDGSGFDFCRELRRSSQVPVLFLSARSGEVDRVVGLELGADDYVVKPFSPREVAARVRAILRRSAASAAPPTPSGPALRLDPEGRRAWYHGRVLDLTTRQLRVLEALAAHPGRVCSRSDLLDSAWDDPSAAFDRTVDSHIKAIRATLRAVRPEPDPIETLRGEGYRLNEALLA